MDKSRFCITGLPRSRTAWLAALMCAHGIETLHEYPPFFDSLEELRAWLYAGTVADPHGYVDGFSLIYHAPLVKQHFADSPIVLIVREPKDVRRSWEAWDGPIDNEVFAAMMARVVRFATEAIGHPNVLAVPYAELEHYATANRIAEHCTDRALKYRTWQLFHRLKIELHKGKCPPREVDQRAILRRTSQ